jgi:hypothetical protein
VEEEIEGGLPKKAVLVLPDGQEIEYPDGGKEVSRVRVRVLLADGLSGLGSC